MGPGPEGNSGLMVITGVQTGGDMAPASEGDELTIACKSDTLPHMVLLYHIPLLAEKLMPETHRCVQRRHLRVRSDRHH